jgi:hypothetical protein
MFAPPCPVFLDDGHDDAGMVTPEYAVGMLATVSLAIGLLIAVRSEAVRQAIADLVMDALKMPG